MTKRQKGFSLAEVLITLLIVGVVGAAAIPTMTKRQTGTDKMWDWADYPVGSAYSVGTHVLLDKNGNDVPEGLNYFSEAGAWGLQAQLLQDNSAPTHDKLMLINNFSEIDGADSNVFAKPHISFYNVNKDRNLTQYAGSLTSDKYNLSLGVGALQSLIPSGVTGRYNTSVGHYSLFNNVNGSNNTALGRMALVSLGGTSVGNYNVAVGDNSLLNNVSGSLNTAVGYNSLTATETGSNNIALGAQALGLYYLTGMPFEYGENNIAIGRWAGQISQTMIDNNKLPVSSDNNLFIDSNMSTVPVIQANVDDDFNINANELIVNTADGKHTILKIRMIDDAGADLPTLDDNGYSKLGYCKGEGSDDIKKTDNDKSALAEVCIAKFKGQSIVVPVYSTSPTVSGRTWIDFDRIIKNGLGGINSTKTISDWDIYLRGLDIGRDGGISTGSNDHAHIQTVKASLNFLERFKESPGWFGMAGSAFMHNLKCAFSYFFGGCGEFIPGPQRNFVEEVKSFFESLSKRFWEMITSDRRLKNISSKSIAGLKEINALKIKNYTYKADKLKTPHVGVIAQELQKVFPNSVIEGSDGYLRIKQEEIFFAMVNAIKELDKKDKELRAEISIVNKQIKDAVDQNKKLLTKNELLKIENEKLQAQLKEIEAQQ